jgi:UDP-glucose 4-epimerase
VTGLSGASALITGGMGFIGSNLAARLISEGASVTLVDSLIPEYGGNVANVRELQGLARINISDVRDRFSLAALVRGHDLLFNLAGQSSHLDSMTDPYTDLDINCRAQLFILEACRAHNPTMRVVFASTRQLYGRPEYLPVDEAHPINPVDVNGINKLAGESYHRLYYQIYAQPTCVLRLTNTFGPHMRIKDARQTFLGVWIRQVLQGEPLEVWGGEQLRDFTYVDDCVAALLLAATDPAAVGQTFNVGGCPPVSLAELAEMLLAVNGGGTFEIRAFPPERKAIDIGDFYSDDRLLRGTLGWAPQVDLEEGLRRTLAYYRGCLADYI